MAGLYVSYQAQANKTPMSRNAYFFWRHLGLQLANILERGAFIDRVSGSVAPVGPERRVSLMILPIMLTLGVKTMTRSGLLAAEHRAAKLKFPTRRCGSKRTEQASSGGTFAAPVNERGTESTC